MTQTNIPQASTEDRHAKAIQKQRQIKEVKTKLQNLSPKAAAEAVEEVVAQQARKQVGGLTNFLRDQGVVGVGIGLVFGIQIKAVVDTVMASLVNPITKLALPDGENLAAQKYWLSIGDRGVDIGLGAIAYSLLTFMIVAFIVYIAYKGLKLDRLAKRKDDKK